MIADEATDLSNNFKFKEKEVYLMRYLKAIGIQISKQL